MAPQPKRRHAGQRGRVRRDVNAISITSLAPCANCRRLILPHRICAYCGFYAGKEIIQSKKKSKALKNKNENEK